MHDNAMECVVWMASEINENLHHVKVGELFYQLPGHEQAKCSITAARVCTETERMLSLRAEEINSVSVSAMESEDENNQSQADQPSWLSRCRKEGNKSIQCLFILFSFYFLLSFTNKIFTKRK